MVDGSAVLGGAGRREEVWAGTSGGAIFKPKIPRRAEMLLQTQPKCSDATSIQLPWKKRSP